MELVGCWSPLTALTLHLQGDAHCPITRAQERPKSESESVRFFRVSEQCSFPVFLHFSAPEKSFFHLRPHVLATNNSGQGPSSLPTVAVATVTSRVE